MGTTLGLNIHLRIGARSSPPASSRSSRSRSRRLPVVHRRIRLIADEFAVEIAWIPDSVGVRWDGDLVTGLEKQLGRNEERGRTTHARLVVQRCRAANRAPGATMGDAYSDGFKAHDYLFKGARRAFAKGAPREGHSGRSNRGCTGTGCGSARQWSSAATAASARYVRSDRRDDVHGRPLTKLAGCGARAERPTFWAGTRAASSWKARPRRSGSSS